MANFKLEKGTKATDWTPAPEDQVTDWNVTDVNSFAFLKNKPTQLSQFTDNIGVATHIANTSNPHAVTTSQIGAVDLTTNQTIGGAKTFSSNVNMLGSLNITGTSGYSEGIRIKGVAGISSIWFNAVNNSGYDPKMYGLTVDSTGLRFRYGTGSTPSDIASISNTGNITASAGVTTPKVDFGNGFTVEPSGTELVFKYNGVIKQRMLSDGSIVATGELTAYVAAT
jgi:hypothetical protein